MPVVRVWNKIDRLGHKPGVDSMPDATHVYLSAHEHIGIGRAVQRSARRAEAADT